MRDHAGRDAQRRTRAAAAVTGTAASGYHRLVAVKHRARIRGGRVGARGGLVPLVRIADHAVRALRAETARAGLARRRAAHQLLRGGTREADHGTIGSRRIQLLTAATAHAVHSARTGVHLQQRHRLRCVRGETHEARGTVAVAGTGASAGAELVAAAGAIQGVVSRRLQRTRLRGARQIRRVRGQSSRATATAGDNHRHAVHLNRGRTAARGGIKHGVHAAMAHHTTGAAGQALNRGDHIRRDRGGSLRGTAHAVAITTLGRGQLTVTDAARTGRQGNHLAAAHRHGSLYKGARTGVRNGVVRAAGAANHGETHASGTRGHGQNGNLLHAVTGGNQGGILVGAGTFAFLGGGGECGNQGRSRDGGGSPGRTGHETTTGQARTGGGRNWA